MQTADSRYKLFFLFGAISLIYIITRSIIFKGFNGTDDLHYAMLASRMIKGTYSPFAEGDIFSGRVLLIGWQAFIYRIAGINVFSTQVGAMLAILLSCYLTVFKLLRAGTASLVIIATSLFYFNPVLTGATIGVLPDVYIALAGVIILVLWNKAVQQNHTAKNIVQAIFIGVIIAACMFVKETIILFFLLVAFLAFKYKSRQSIITCMAMISTLLICGILIGEWYYYNTGDIFFRLKQVQNSYYYNPCSYDIIPASYLIARLTYQPWQEFIAHGFYPVIFTSALVVYSLFLRKPLAIFKDPFVVCFFVLLITGLYFPFSIKGYQPLCGEIRHFLFLLPLGVCVISRYITTNIENGKTIKWAIISLIVLILCIAGTPDKWQWMMWCLFTIYFIILKVLPGKISFNLKALAFGLLLWLCMPYHLFYGNSNWFTDMRQLNKQLTGTHYYFADHDNMMHWKLLHQFSDTVHVYDMDAYPFKVFQLYYEKIDTANFHPGWFLVNTKYTERSDGFLHSIDSLQQKKYFNTLLNIGDIQAIYLQQPAQLAFVKNLVENDIKVLK